MANTAQQAYDAIQNLEKQGVLSLPAPGKTVHVGSFNAATGKFQYGITTVGVVDIETGPDGKPVIIKSTAGEIKLTNVVDLHLQFSVTNPQGPFSVTFEGAFVSAAAGSRTVTIAAGLAQSIVGSDGKISTLQGSLRSGGATTDFQLEIIRLPVATGGALTFPAIPIALVYAPPPGSLNKNFAEYSSMNSSSRKISTTVTSGTSNKSADAYSTTDFIDKIASTVGSIQSFVTAFTKNQGTKDAIAVAGASTILGLNALSGILSSTTTSTTTALTTTDEHDLAVTDTDTTTTGTPAGLGPGVGDRFVYLRNVKVAWLVVNGAMSITVLGDDGIRSFTAQQLSSDAKAIAASPTTVTVGPVTNLDAATLKMLLDLDPFVANPSPTLQEPRFAQNDPPTAAGSGTDPNGDILSVSHEVSTTDTHTTTSLTTTVTDTKPGWLATLFGLEDNQATENQTTLGYSTSVSDGTDDKQTATVTFFANPGDPPYAVGLYFDRLFGTFAFTPAIATVKMQSGAAARQEQAGIHAA